MSALTVSDEHTASTKAKVIQPAWVRALHWTNAFAMVLMIMSGWQIYNASPLFDFRFSPSITLGGWLAGALLWHFAAMWLLMVNGLIYLVMGLVTGRFRKKLLPITPEEVELLKVSFARNTYRIAKTWEHYQEKARLTGNL